MVMFSRWFAFQEYYADCYIAHIPVCEMPYSFERVPSTQGRSCVAHSELPFPAALTLLQSSLPIGRASSAGL